MVAAPAPAETSARRSRGWDPRRRGRRPSRGGRSDRRGRAAADLALAAAAGGAACGDPHALGHARYGSRMNILINADTIRSPDSVTRSRCRSSSVPLRESDGSAFAAVSPLDAPTIAAARPDLQRLDVGLGLGDLLAGGTHVDDALSRSACGVPGDGRDEGGGPARVTLATAEALRAAGVKPHVDRAVRHPPAVQDGRRVGGDPARDRGGRSRPDRRRGGAALDEPLTCERLREIVRAAVEARGAVLRECIVATARRPRPATKGPARSRPANRDRRSLAPGPESACFRTSPARSSSATDPEIASGTRSCWRHARAIAGVRAGAAPVRCGNRRRITSKPPGFPPSATRAELMKGFPTAPGTASASRSTRTWRRPPGEEPLAAGDVVAIEPFLCRRARRRPGRGPAARHRGRRRTDQHAHPGSLAGRRVGSWCAARLARVRRPPFEEARRRRARNSVRGIRFGSRGSLMTNSAAGCGWSSGSW